MSVRVRYAPSPTGLQHIGGARTALFDFLLAKAKGGTFVLRIEDTDQERSKKEFEDAMIEDLKWCGLDYDEGPDKPGEYGPYRQSERKDIYKKYADQLLAEGKAYYCFLTSSELEELTAKAEAEKKAPHAYHGKYRDLPVEEAKAKVAAGEEHVLRYKNPQKTYSFKDLVRGEVTYGPDMIGDFVIVRSNGMAVYNFCCVVDDWLMKISHVIRAEEHLNNTLRQLIIYEGLGAEAPTFVHCSLLVGEDRQKLSKRHGATSVSQYKDENYLPQALMNYLCLLGWSHPSETDIFTLDEVASVFDTDRFNKSPALYDVTKLQFFNGQHLRKLPTSELVPYLSAGLDSAHGFFSQSAEWQETVCEFFKEKINLPSEFSPLLDVLLEVNLPENDEVKDVRTWETTPTIVEYVGVELKKLQDSGADSVTAEDFSNWMSHLKKELKIKGKPLFKGLRVALTGQAEGPDLKVIIPLTSMEILSKRFS